MRRKIRMTSKILMKKKTKTNKSNKTIKTNKMSNRTTTKKNRKITTNKTSNHMNLDNKSAKTFLRTIRTSFPNLTQKKILTLRRESKQKMVKSNFNYLKSISRKNKSKSSSKFMLSLRLMIDRKLNLSIWQKKNKVLLYSSNLSSIRFKTERNLIFICLFGKVEILMKKIILGRLNYALDLCWMNPTSGLSTKSINYKLLNFRMSKFPKESSQFKANG